MKKPRGGFPRFREPYGGLFIESQPGKILKRGIRQGGMRTSIGGGKKTYLLCRGGANIACRWGDFATLGSYLV